jgi:hypothetical protein
MAHLPKADLGETPKLSKHFAFPTNPMCKGVWKSRLSETESDSVIKEVMD